MTEIDFYTQVDDRFRVACHLVQKAHAQGMKTLVLLEDDASLQLLDERLWTFQAHSFIPHCRAEDSLADQTPVWLACQDVPSSGMDDLLVNLCSEAPPSFARFRRLVEIVSTEAAELSAARNRFKFYRDRGFLLRTHDLSASAAQRRAPGRP